MKKKYYELSRMLLIIVLMITCHLNVAAQGINISGVVNDESGEPIPGVSVVINETTTGTITDLNGNYNLQNVSEGCFVFLIIIL